MALAKAKAETDTLRVKCQYLQEKIEDLTKERDFLRQQLSEVTEPWQVVKRYKSVLEIFKRGSNMADAFRKYGVDRNTIVQSAAIAELVIAAPEKYEEINDKNAKGEKLSNIAQKCQDAIMADENIANKIQTMKTFKNNLPLNTP
ncbi:coiled-coil domain-containing protein 106-like [Sinocyclocheilus anshuiensis]|uniref:coiled-coil domain-containing protein 106-like n=1 Tax=Sinocyclocheilus anshuiensis TaxID=1608454 RepID=UPI0007BABABB|nr:PREDICTED: coiled-coil domain-containing protein 106-like [Sinocyclocheilus anshuiensis]